MIRYIQLIYQSQSIGTTNHLWYWYLGSLINLQLDPGSENQTDNSMVPHSNFFPFFDEDKWVMVNVPYRQPIRSLMCAVVATWLNISFEVSLLSQFFENPGEIYWNAVKCVLKYLKGMKDYKPTLRRNWEGLVGYVDIDWDLQDHRQLNLGLYFPDWWGNSSMQLPKAIHCHSVIDQGRIHHINPCEQGSSMDASLITEIFQPLNFPIKIYSHDHSAIATTYSTTLKDEVLWH